jgi:putative transposase
MKLRYNYRLNPTKQQEELLKQAGGTTRFLWNHFLEQNVKKYEEEKKFSFYYEMAVSLPKLKKELTWLKNTYSQVLQQVLKDLDGALKFKKHGRGFPNFKSKYAKRDSFRYVQNTKIEDNKYLLLPKIGRIRIKLHRQLPKYSSVTIYQDQGHWCASFVVEKETKPKQQIKRAIGIDMNSSCFATSEGKMISNPKFLKQAKDQVKGLQRALSRKQKGSSMRTKAKDRLGRVMRSIRNRRHTT